MIFKVRSYRRGMSVYFVDYVTRTSAFGACALALGALLFFAPAAHADECLNAVSSTATPDFDLCGSDLPDIDLDAALADHATAKSSKSAKAADGVPWIVQSEKGIPLSVNSSGSNVSLRTSLDDLRTFNTQNYTVDAAGAGALTIPKASTANLPVDVWTNVDVNGYQGERDQSTRTGLGVDYKLSRKAVVGVSVERGDARSMSGTEADSKASAYVTLQATPLISLDARTQWQTGNAEFAAANGAAENSAVILAPKIDHSFELGDGKTISPFVTYKREFDMSPGAFNAPERSAGAGVTYKDSDAYTLSVTTDVDAATANAPQSVSSKFKLSVPIN
jgi:hypothetical protein